MSRREGLKKTVIKKVVKMPKFAQEKIKKKLIEENDSIINDNKKASIELKQIEEKKEAVDNDLKSISNVFESRKKELEEATHEYETLIAETKELEKLLYKSKKEQEKELNADIAQLNTTKESLESEIVELKKDISVLDLNKRELETNETRIKSIINTEEKRLSEVKHKIVAENLVLSGIESKIKHYSDDLERKEGANSKLDEKILTLQTVVEVERQKLSETNEQNKIKQEELEEKNKSLEDMQKRMFGFIKRENRINGIIPELKKLAEQAGYNLTI